jgi:hypothetical protein
MTPFAPCLKILAPTPTSASGGSGHWPIRRSSRLRPTRPIGTTLEGWRIWLAPASSSLYT